jgi:hypothetical protein
MCCKDRRARLLRRRALPILSLTHAILSPGEYPYRDSGSVCRDAFPSPRGVHLRGRARGQSGGGDGPRGVLLMPTPAASRPML